MMTEKIKILLPYARNLFQTTSTVHKTLTPLKLLHGVSASKSQVPHRSLTTKALTRNIEIISNSSSKEILTDTVNPLRLHRESSEEDRPLSILLCWMMSEKKHILKYAHFYLDQGFDVLTVQTTPWQLLWPVKGTQLIARDIVTFMNQNPQYNSTMIHGFSVGGYLWGEVLTIFQEEERYRELVDRIVGQIWDSVVDFEGIPTGLPKAVFPNNAVLRTSLEKYLSYHMAKFHDVATRHYLKASSNYHNPIVEAPALFLCSLDDPVGNEECIRKVIGKWNKKGISTRLRCWQSSPHVSHLHHHPKEYKEEMKEFLEKLGLVPYPEKLVHKVSVRQ